jgi:prepilin-type N-terminal cleavage/methylation domain-containing protein
MKSFQKAGFTLIELLIVIALLGALAVGLLATVDPFEQLKKGTDTSTRNTAAEAYNAMVRYYAQRGSFPTSMSSLVGAGTFTLGNAVAQSGLTEIAAAGELKNDFGNLAGTSNLARIYMNIPTSEKVVVCVNPQSKAFRNDQNTKFDVTGGNDTACPNATSTSCYVCFQ